MVLVPLLPKCFKPAVITGARRGCGQSPVYANRAGTVTFSGNIRGHGKTVIIDHGSGSTTRYAHLDKSFVRPGRNQFGLGRVSEGQMIGILGQTGNAAGRLASEAHVHFECRGNGLPKNPAD